MTLPIRLPTELLSAHDKGRLVFFCGAGISRYTGLGDFKGLVEDIFAMCGLPLFPEASCATCGQPHPSVIGTRSPEEDAFHRGAYDRALHLLEAKSDYMRPAAVEVLGAPSSDPDLKTHKALLALSRHPEGGHRLVTTNFDRRFEEAEPNLEFQAGPYLTLPRPESWRRLTYLHGRLDPLDDPGGNGLVLTSGDFSRAYLQDGWAARFALHLFETYTILFVGYSLNDPVVSYLIDGLAADMRRRGESLNAYILADHDGTEAGRRTVEMTWESRGLIPIPFDRKDDFVALHQTLHCWAEIDTAKRDRRFETLLEPFLHPYDPKTTGTADLELLLWLLSADNGAIADAFADADPPPDISWLKPIAETKLNLPIAKGSVSLLNLPSPGVHVAPLAGPGAANLPGLTLSPVTLYLGRWLAKHRDKTELVDWVIERGGRIHPQWADSLERDLDTVDKPFAAFWRLVIDPIIPVFQEEGRYFLGPISDGRWPENGDEWLFRACQPRLKLSKTFSRIYGEPRPPEKLSDIVAVGLKLTEPSFLDDVWKSRQSPEIRAALIRNVDVLTSALADGARLIRQTDHDLFFDINCRSLTQGSDFDRMSFPLLVRLCVAAFDMARDDRPVLADALLLRWLMLGRVESLSIFRRMALHALCFVHPAPPDEELDLLLDDHATVLWRYEYNCEVGQYLRLRARTLPQESLDRLLAVIARGPSRGLFPNYSTETSQREVALRLAKLRMGGVALPAELAQQADNAVGILEKERNRRFEFGWRKRETADQLIDLPPDKIADHLVNEPDSDNRRDRLLDLCRNHCDLAMKVVSELTDRIHGPDPLWSGLTGFGDVEDESKRLLILRTLHDLFRPRPDNFIDVLCWTLASVIVKLFPSLPVEGEDRAMALDFWQMVWQRALPFDAGKKQNFDTAISTASGELATAAIDLALRHDGPIPVDVMHLLDQIVAGETDSHRFGRIILASRLLWLHHRDQDWANRHLIARMKWPHPEAVPMWQGFCWYWRLSIPLMSDLRDALLSVAGHIEDVHAREVWNHLFVETLIELPKTFTSDEIGPVMRQANGDDLAQMAEHLALWLGQTEDEAPIRWGNTIRPIICQHWPSVKTQRTSANIESLVKLAISAGSAFPDAIALMLKRKLLGPVDERTRLFYRLSTPKENAPDPCSKYPDTALSLLDAIVGETLPPYESGWISQSLDRIVAADPTLAEDTRMKRLRRRLS
ncbi:SIR2 family protein [Magnetospirillum fulvum]|uniref:SIR2-like domain-containing protein n=1 Tax=Magnetospirillum fulvum TaxID=1082 RepID=A0A1H6HIB0_MAGFU|nr:SIR2 family protein [Magnetospirillum fulvum]SEH33974.1 SIR2-like domain-containing protein [Magnetospirillum fulvum]